MPSRLAVAAKATLHVARKVTGKAAKKAVTEVVKRVDAEIRPPTVHIEEWDAEGLMALAMDAAESAMTRSAFLVEAEAKKSMPKQGAGRAYTRHGKKHLASRPDEPPAVDTGDLKKSIHSEVIRGKDEVLGFVGSDLPYALPLETGTKNMQPRPYLRPALRKNERQIEKMFKEGNH